MRSLSHPAFSATLMRRFRPLVVSIGRRSIRLDMADLSEGTRRDLGFMDGRAAPPRDPLRD